MKQIILTVALMAIVAVSTQAKTIIKDTESFTISTNDMPTLDQDFAKSWTIAYGEENKTIEVVKVNGKKGEVFIVRNQFFEISYTNTKNGFGARKVKKNNSEIDPIITNSVLNGEEIANQSLLSAKQLSEEKALSYIAGFVPFLLNENYKHLLN